jgi:hypothetical protein
VFVIDPTSELELIPDVENVHGLLLLEHSFVKWEVWWVFGVINAPNLEIVHEVTPIDEVL